MNKLHSTLLDRLNFEIMLAVKDSRQQKMSKPTQFLVGLRDKYGRAKGHAFVASRLNTVAQPRLSAGLDIIHHDVGWNIINTDLILLLPVHLQTFIALLDGPVI